MPTVVHADGPAADNVYQLGSMSPTDLSLWQPLGSTEIQLSPDGKVDPYFTLEATDDFSKAPMGVKGLFRKGLNCPLPREVRFQVSVSNASLSLILGDSSGHKFVKPEPLATQEGEWSQISVPLSATGLRNLDTICVMFNRSEQQPPMVGSARCRLSSFQLVYSAGTGPSSAFTRQDMEKRLAPLDAQIARIQSLMPQAAAAGAETRYFKVSLTVLKRYRGEGLDMIQPGDPQGARRMAAYLLECAARTEQGLIEGIKHPKATVPVPAVSLLALKVRDGSFYSGSRPVFPLGVCGWFDPSRLDTLADSGFTAIATEMGPSAVLPAEGKTDPAALNAIGSLFDAAAKHNMAIDLLLSPHYMPEWAYKKWPDIDPEDRRHHNQFMPWDVRSPHLRDLMTLYLSTTIPALKDKPALLDYDLINEAWYGPFGMDGAALAQSRAAGSAGSDWDIRQQYTTPLVSDFFQWYYDKLRSYDNTHAVYAKVLGSDEILCVDRESVGDILNANGMDSYPGYPTFSGDLAADMVSTLMRLDFHRSLTPEKPIIDGEYHIFSGTYDYPDNYVRTALWDAALHGKDAAALWTADRADAASVAWHPNGMEVTGETALDFQRLGPEIQAFQRQKTLVALFYDWKAMREPYQALLFQDRDIGIITDKRIGDGKLSQYKVLVLPGGSTPNADSAKRIAEFEKAGGRVVRCSPAASARELYPVLHAAIAEDRLPAFVHVNTWGVECRSVLLGSRKLMYLINYCRTSVDVQPKSDWDLSHLVDLRTQKPLNGAAIHLAPLEMRLMEAGRRE